MRTSPSVLTLAVTLVLPAALAAQAAAPAPAASRPPGCRGITNSTSSYEIERPGQDPVVFRGYPVMDDVQPGSPADRAGMKIGDYTILQDGHDVIANPSKKTYLAGDTVVFVIRRDGTEIPLTVVLGRWDPAEETDGVDRICRPVDAAASH